MKISTETCGLRTWQPLTSKPSAQRKLRRKHAADVGRGSAISCPMQQLFSNNLPGCIDIHSVYCSLKEKRKAEQKEVERMTRPSNATSLNCLQLLTLTCVVALLFWRGREGKGRHGLKHPWQCRVCAIASVAATARSSPAETKRRSKRRLPFRIDRLTMLAASALTEQTDQDLWSMKLRFVTIMAMPGLFCGATLPHTEDVLVQDRTAPARRLLHMLLCVHAKGFVLRLGPQEYRRSAVDISRLGFDARCLLAQRRTRKPQNRNTENYKITTQTTTNKFVRRKRRLFGPGSCKCSGIETGAEDLHRRHGGGEEAQRGAEKAPWGLSGLKA